MIPKFTPELFRENYGIIQEECERMEIKTFIYEKYSHVFVSMLTCNNNADTRITSGL